MDSNESRINLSLQELNELIEQRIENELSRRLSNLQSKETEDETIQDNGWIRLAMSREAGEIELPEELAHIFHKDQMQNLYCKSSVTKFLYRHLELKGGYLKTQSLENQIAASPECKRSDESLQDIQRAVLCTIRPILTVYKWITEAIESTRESENVKTILEETMQYINHVAATLRVHRRIQIARKLDLCPLSDSHFKIGSTEENHLFGPELRSALESEKKASSRIVPKGRTLRPTAINGRRGYHPQRNTGFRQQPQQTVNPANNTAIQHRTQPQ